MTKVFVGRTANAVLIGNTDTGAALLASLELSSLGSCIVCDRLDGISESGPIHLELP